MGVYIRGMEMPKNQVCVILNPNGLVEVIDANNVLLEEYQAVSFPPHGRLIDADLLTEKLKKHREYHSDGSKSGAAISNGIGQCLDIINGRESPTIIPAEEGET